MDGRVDDGTNDNGNESRGDGKMLDSSFVSMSDKYKTLTATVLLS